MAVTEISTPRAPPALESRRPWLAWLSAPLAVLGVLFLRRQHDELYARPAAEGENQRFGDRAVVTRLVLSLAAQDWLLLGYLLTLGLRVLTGAETIPVRRLALGCVGIDVAVFVAILGFVRTRERCSTIQALVYRVGVLFALLASFLQLQWILPAANGPAVDAELHALDLRLFGVEPALAWDKFVSPATTEWFSFFYYGYFILLAVHVLPALFFGKRDQILVPMGFGILWLYCVGHVVYTLVPAYGPYAHLKFEHTLEGRTWWPLVQGAVLSVDGSARTDVFPSLHTAGPTFLTLFSFRYRQFAPFKYTWLPLGFCAVQIIGATMFLRWHYLIDICAGLLLGSSGVFVGTLASWWEDGRVAAGGPAVWPRVVRF
jgi:hypothetical protein